MGIVTDTLPFTSVPSSNIAQQFVDKDYVIEECEFVQSCTKEELAKMCGIPEEDFEFDFEKDLEDSENDDQQEAYMFELVIDDDDFNRVEFQDDTDDEEVQYANNVNEQFPTFNEMFAEEYLLKQKVEEKQRDVPVVK
ncbi:hypothetical protein Hanom_Chr05g00439861 [Helianthus anomalus]